MFILTRNSFYIGRSISRGATVFCDECLSLCKIFFALCSMCEIMHDFTLLTANRTLL